MTTLTPTALTVGAVYSAQLHGLAGAWTVHGSAILWAVHHDDGQDHVTLQLSSHPDPRRTGHTAYAQGQVSRLPDGRRQLVSPLTPQPGPTAITLGWTVQHHRDRTDADRHCDLAEAELAAWRLPTDPAGPLGVSALTLLDRAVQRALDGRDAERERDDLVRRLRAGGVPRDVVATRAGLDPSRITQLCKVSARERIDA
ncbi:hypothetical protein [Streptomyces sp. CB03911]|uniref:hypothetical protein n=1 Tax=Streptomyces sp. CB03911 TaxID=1804758 RepID=UPI0009397F6E|nr:hypothetical protein [Streptomyces sp. CB03911]OKI22222.1 hypothetical protein A6A07_34680 [Streptomyces sp. CB03911]